MISVANALAIISDNFLSPESEHADLRQALGRVLAVDVSAKLTHPPLDASAMDGYAVQLSDIKDPGAQLCVIGEAPAGTPFSRHVGAGQAVRIFTGGAVPHGADTVIIQENVKRVGETITIIEPQNTARHIRRAGLDFKANDVLIPKGTVLSPAEIAVAAASGHVRLCVFKKLSVAIISGGDELIPPGDTPKTGQIINSNPYALAALIEDWGHDALILPTAQDSVESLTEHISAAEKADIIVAVGGASVGDYDYMRAAFTQAGLIMLFEKVAVRPGKPTWFGRLGNRPVLGLPGNPASAIVCAHIFMRPLLSGAANKVVAARLSETISGNGPRETYLRAIVTPSAKGRLNVRPLPKQDSGLMTPFLTANALLKRAPNAEPAKTNDIVEVILINFLILNKKNPPFPNRKGRLSHFI